MRRDAFLIAVYLAGFIAVTAGLAAGGPLIDLDLAVYEWAERHRPPAAATVARLFNMLGQGGILVIVAWVLAEWLVLRRRKPEPVLYVSVAAILVMPTVLIIKWVTERGAPSSGLPAEQVVRLLGPLPPSEYAAGYPSGHVVNTIVWYGVLLLLIVVWLRSYDLPVPPRWLRATIRVAPVVIVLCTTTYLSFHWLTDGLAGLALGLAFDRILALRQWRL